jgi:hypothetical protein
MQKGERMNTIKSGLNNFKQMRPSWWIGEFISCVLPTILVIIIYKFKIFAYDIVAFTIAIFGIATTVLIIYYWFRVLGDLFKKKFR